MHVVEGIQALLDLLCVLFKLGVGGEQVLGRCYLEVTPTNSPLKLLEERLTPLTGFGGWLSESLSASV